MNTFKYNKFMLLIMAVALAAALVINWNRYCLESNNRQIDLVMDYADMVSLARSEGESLAEVMHQFQEAGLTSLAVYDSTLKELHQRGKISMVAGYTLLEQQRLGLTPSLGITRPDARCVYVLGMAPGVPDPIFDQTKDDLVQRLGNQRVQELADAPQRTLAIVGDYESLLKLPLGLSRSEMETAAQAGFHILARPANYKDATAADVQAVFQRLQGIPAVTGMMFTGDTVLGYPEQLDVTARALKENHMRLVLIEDTTQLQFLKQDGLIPLAEKIDYHVARAYIITKEEQTKLKMAEAINRTMVTDRERNVRLNLLRKFEKPQDGKSLLETNLDYVRGVKQEMTGYGFTFGPSTTFPPYFPQRFLLVLVMAGCVAAGVLYLAQLVSFPAKCQYATWILLTLVLGVPILLGHGTLARQLAALAAACICPVLAMTWQLDRWRYKEIPREVPLLRILVDAVLALTATVALSLVGGMLVAAVLGDVRFMMEIDIYRGVKLTFILPLILITLVYLTRYPLVGSPVQTFYDFWDRSLVFLNYSVKMKTLMLVSLAGIAAWIFVGRSGHSAGVPVPAAEIKMRTLLENIMYARPREKEFVIGHPAFMLAVMSVWKRWPLGLHYFLVVAAVIGQGSLVETFAHIRTPVFMSFVRALDGLGAGILIGILLLLAVWVLQVLSAQWGRSRDIHE